MILSKNEEESVSMGMENDHIGVTVEPDAFNRMDVEVEDDSESEDNCYHDEDNDLDDVSFQDADEEDGSVLQVLPDGEDELWEGDTEDTDDLGVDASNDGHEDLEAHGMPTTSASRKRLHFDSSKSAKEGISTPNHVPLNFQGNLLLRHHKKLSPTAANRNFLQKLNATHEGDGVRSFDLSRGNVVPGFLLGSRTGFFECRCHPMRFAAG